MEYNGYTILGDGTYGYKKVKTLDGNNPPELLAGIYTTTPEAKRGIDGYISAQELIKSSKPPVLQTKPVSERKLAELVMMKAKKENERNGATKGSRRDK